MKNLNKNFQMVLKFYLRELWMSDDKVLVDDGSVQLDWAKEEDIIMFKALCPEPISYFPFGIGDPRFEVNKDEE